MQFRITFYKMDTYSMEIIAPDERKALEKAELLLASNNGSFDQGEWSKEDYDIEEA